MKLTREEAIQKHRELWNWIADETERQQDFVSKEEYYYEHPEITQPLNLCFCCQYVDERSDYNASDCVDERSDYNASNCLALCPIKWKSGHCEWSGSEYREWRNAEDWLEAAKYARIIANLPERSDA